MDARHALSISRSIAKEVKKTIEKLNNYEKGKTVGFGVDGGETKLIDFMAEKAALDILKKEKLTVFSEESGFSGEGDVFVALDPLDGTFNAENNIPLYSVSLNFSFSEKLKDTFFAYVYNLSTDDEYYADVKAYKNGKELKVSDVESLFCNSIFYYPTKVLPFKRIRVFGCASLELCMVASGVFDCFIDIRNVLRFVDASAAIYIVEKAGGKVTDEFGKPLSEKKIDERLNVVASNPKLHKKILKMVL
ncbi:MAG: inositol monophosphatase [Archaeoglobaceae archaeon]|nr:inositol monophosphatase [Archaeoglobaceae archaeon]MCX8152202.1 inositol monophosphatase [Archaeoglobaceae archaeon]